jgi:hypothetical protein
MGKLEGNVLMKEGRELMSIEENVQVVKISLQRWAAAIRNVC